MADGATIRKTSRDVLGLHLGSLCGRKYPKHRKRRTVTSSSKEYQNFLGQIDIGIAPLRVSPFMAPFLLNVLGVR